MTNEIKQRIEQIAYKFNHSFDPKVTIDSVLEEAYGLAQEEIQELKAKLTKWDEVMKAVGLHPKVEDWTNEIARLTAQIEGLKAMVKEAEDIGGYRF